MAGTELAKAYVQIIPSTNGLKGKLTSALSGEASSAGDAAGNAAGNSLASSIKNVIMAAGIGVALKNAIMEGADLQQSLGGIETLFKDSADKVIANAKIAYKTAGMSANEYMETVTSFSASLLQGLAGDTQKAADIADMALTDMSDNANKMGTSMELIQNAYQGFAKQNYTMLDNLKLGYGGTKTEMERLLADATELSGIKYDLSNLSDVYEAIHVIQEEMGITGTTAKEAASTLSGSLASMKASFSDLLGNLALGEDIIPSLKALEDTVFTFLEGNLFPMIGNVLMNLPQVLESAFSMAIGGLNMAGHNADAIVKNGIEIMGQLAVGIISATPYLIESSVRIIASLGSALINADWLGIATNMLNQLKNNLSLAAGEILGTDGSIVETVFSSIKSEISEAATSTANVFYTDFFSYMEWAFATAMPNLLSHLKDNIIESFSGQFEKLLVVLVRLKEILQPLAEIYISGLANALVDFTYFIESFVVPAVGLVSDIFLTVSNTILNSIKPAIDNIYIAYRDLQSIYMGVFEHIITLCEDFVEMLQQLWSENQDKIGAIGELFKTVFDAIAGITLWFVDIVDQYLYPIFRWMSEFVRENMDSIKAVFQSTFDIIGGIVELFTSLFKGDWEGMWEAVKTITESWGKYLENQFYLIAQYLTSIGEAIWNAISGPLQAVKDSIAGVLEQLKTAITEKFEAVKSSVVQTWENIKNSISSVIEQVITTVTEKFEAVKSAVMQAWETIKDSISEALELVKAVVTEKFEAVKSAVMQAWETIKNVISFSIQLIAGILSAAFQIITLPFQFIWQNCKEYIIAAWEAIKTAVSDALNAVKESIISVWSSMVSVLAPVFTAIQNAVTTAWETVKTAVSDALNAIKDTVSTVWESIVSVLESVFTTIKDAVTTAWEAVATTISDVLESIKDTISAVWESIVAVLESVFTTIKDAVTAAWESITTTISSVLETIKTTMINVWNTISNTVSTVVNTIKTAIKNAFDSIKEVISEKTNAAKSTVTDVFEKIKSTITDKVTGVKNVVTDIFDKIKNAISDKINAAKEAVGAAIEKLKSYFDFEWSLPHIKLPHFNITGSFSINPPSVPTFGIEWYAKAMNEPMIMNSPTAFGINSLGQIMAGGEAGSEVVSGTDTLMKMIAAAVASQNGTLANSMNDGFNNLIILLNNYLPELANMQLVMDTGAVVAELAPVMDSGMDTLVTRRNRGW